MKALITSIILHSVTLGVVTMPVLFYMWICDVKQIDGIPVGLISILVAAITTEIIIIVREYDKATNHDQRS